MLCNDATDSYVTSTYINNDSFKENFPTIYNNNKSSELILNYQKTYTIFNYCFMGPCSRY